MLPAVVSMAPALFSLIDNLFTSDKERDEAKLKLLALEKTGALEELKISMSAILAEAQSADPYTSRARPTFLYVMYAAIILCFVGAIIGIWYPAQVDTAATNLGKLLNAIPESLWWLFGAGFLGYTATRSFDKWKGSK